MQKTLIAILALATTDRASFCQQSEGFSFKNATLGMSLSEFRIANKGGTIWINSGKPNWRGVADPKLTVEVQLPLCTDVFRHFPGDDQTLAEGEVLCNPAPSTTANRQALELMGEPVTSITYRFYKGLLYRIELVFPAYRFGLIAAGFGQKYGPPAERRTDYQNGFGARWSGAHLEWSRGHSLVTLTEGSSNGPGQSAGFSLGSFVAEDLAPTDSDVKPKLDF